MLSYSEGLVAISKPPGLASTGKTLDDPHCAQYQVIEELGSMAWALHQLDRETSGLLLFTTEKELVAFWQTHWKSLQKTYLVFAHGRLDHQGWELIDAPLLRVPYRESSRFEIRSHGKSAQTKIRQLGTSPLGPYSLFQAQLLTGRTHQIRAHFLHRGIPLIGEALYNDIPCGHHDRTALHSASITTSSNILGDHSFRAPLAPDLLLLAKKLEISIPEKLQ